MKEEIKTALAPVGRYLVRVTTAVSQLANVVVLFGTHPNESISARCYQNEHMSVWWRSGRKALDFIFDKVGGQKDHCRNAFLEELANANRTVNLSKIRIDLPDYYKD